MFISRLPDCRLNVTSCLMLPPPYLPHRHHTCPAATIRCLTPFSCSSQAFHHSSKERNSHNLPIQVSKEERTHKAGCDSPPKSISFSLSAPLLSHTHPHPAAPAHPAISAWLQSLSPAFLITSDHTYCGLVPKPNKGVCEAPAPCPGYCCLLASSLLSKNCSQLEGDPSHLCC